MDPSKERLGWRKRELPLPLPGPQSLWCLDSMSRWADSHIWGGGGERVWAWEAAWRGWSGSSISCSQFDETLRVLLKVINSTFICYRELRTCFQTKDGLENGEAEWPKSHYSAGSNDNKVPKEIQNLWDRNLGMKSRFTSSYEDVSFPDHLTGGGINF